MANDKNKTPFYLIDTSAESYRPIGVRFAICASAALWALMELWHREPFWSVISVACLAYCIFVLFLTYKAPEPTPVRPPDPEDDEEEVVAEKEEPKS